MLFNAQLRSRLNLIKKYCVSCSFVRFLLAIVQALCYINYIKQEVKNMNTIDLERLNKIATEATKITKRERIQHSDDFWVINEFTTEGEMLVFTAEVQMDASGEIDYSQRQFHVVSTKYDGSINDIETALYRLPDQERFFTFNIGGRDVRPVLWSKTIVR